MWEFWGLPDATGEALVKVGGVFLPGSCQQPQHAAHKTHRHSLYPCAACGLFIQGAGLLRDCIWCSQVFSAWQIR